MELRCWKSAEVRHKRAHLVFIDVVPSIPFQLQNLPHAMGSCYCPREFFDDILTDNHMLARLSIKDDKGNVPLASLCDNRYLHQEGYHLPWREWRWLRETLLDGLCTKTGWAFCLQGPSSLAWPSSRSPHPCIPDANGRLPLFTALMNPGPRFNQDVYSCPSPHLFRVTRKGRSWLWTPLERTKATSTFPSRISYWRWSPR